jgi:hypothetical protein|tara:strand:+ start:37724 stop:37975 length:252 start_codon:yes stop_codon:yes gene_type:complete
MLCDELSTDVRHVEPLTVVMNDNIGILEEIIQFIEHGLATVMILRMESDLFLSVLLSRERYHPPGLDHLLEADHGLESVEKVS